MRTAKSVLSTYEGKVFVKKKISDKTPDGLKLIKLTLEKYGIQNYTINDDNTVDVDGAVKLSEKGIEGSIKEHLGIQFGTVKGSFSCGANALTSLEGCPKMVGGTFNCNLNTAKLPNLKGCPEGVGGSFTIMKSRVYSLEGGAKYVKGSYDCGLNRITENLEGAPKEVGGKFDCGFNSLKSLKGCPKKVGGEFNCGSNALRSLKHCPKEIGGQFDCSENLIESLEYSPVTIGKGSGLAIIHGFNAMTNKLKSIKGCPKTIKGVFDISHNDELPVTDKILEDMPDTVYGNFHVDKRFKGRRVFINTKLEKANKQILGSIIFE